MVHQRKHEHDVVGEHDDLSALRLFHQTRRHIVAPDVVKGGYRIVEVPITFSDRQLGSSKLGLRQQWQYLRQLWRLYRALC